MNETQTTQTTQLSKEQLEHSVDVANTLLRGEISAVDAYGQAGEKFREDPAVGELLRIRSEHEEAVQQLRNAVIELRGLPETSSGAWGAITGAIQATANLFGEDSATYSLKRGEALGRKAYEVALEDERITARLKELIRGKLLPMVNGHLERLENATVAKSG